MIRVEWKIWYDGSKYLANLENILLVNVDSTLERKGGGYAIQAGFGHLSEGRPEGCSDSLFSPPTILVLGLMTAPYYNLKA